MASPQPVGVADRVSPSLQLCLHSFTALAHSLHSCIPLDCPVSCPRRRAILVWVGVWDFIVDYMRGGELNFDALYMCLGTLFLLLTRTLIAQAGLKPISYAAHSTQGQSFVTPLFVFLASTHHPPDSSSLALYVRSLLALLAGIVFWLGAYNLLDLWLAPASALRDGLYTIVGLVIMFATANVGAEGSVIADSVAGGGEASKAASTPVTSSVRFVLYQLKALVGLWGDVVYWVGTYNIADVWIWEYSATRDSLYVVAGFIVFLAISMYVRREAQRQALLITRAEQRTVNGTPPGSEQQRLTDPVSADLDTHKHLPPSQPQPTVVSRMLYCVRVAVTMVAGIVFWVGWWNILSTYVYYGSSPSEYHPMSVPQQPSLDVEVSGRFQLMSLVSQPSPVLGQRHRFHDLQRSSQSDSSDSSFPMWILYLLYTVGGIAFLLLSSTLTSSAGVIQPLGTIRERTNVAAAVSAEAVELEEEAQQYAVVEAPGNGAFVLDQEPHAYQP